MSKITDLIAKYCPNGAEYKKFSEVCSYQRGVTYNKTQEISDNTAPCHKVLRANNITLKTNTLNFEDVKHISEAVKIKKEQYLKQGDILICAGSGSKEHIGKVAFIPNDIDYTFGGFMGVIRTNHLVNQRYMFHILTSDIFTNHLDRTLNSSTINNLSTKIMDMFSFPVPPLAVQEEIVNILDSFTLLEAELEKELEKELVARRKQYEYYRNQLVSFGEGGNHACDVKIGTVKDIVSDSFWIMPPTPKYITVGIPYITSKNIGEGKISFDNIKYISHEDFENISAKRPILPGDILISMIGTLGNTAIVSEEYGDFYGQNMFLLRLNPSVLLVKYFMYFFNSVKIKNYLNAIKNNSGQGYLKTQHIENLEIPIPPLAEQERIVAILDKFDALVNDISVGLPAELKARRKQYEYWRNKLLDFKEAV